MYLKIYERYFPGSVVETSPSSAGGVGSIPGEGTKILHALFSCPFNLKIVTEV